MGTGMGAGEKELVTTELSLKDLNYVLFSWILKCVKLRLIPASRTDHTAQSSVLVTSTEHTVCARMLRRWARTASWHSQSAKAQAARPGL